MTIQELEALMIEKGLVIRAIPREITETMEVRHADRYPDGVIAYEERYKREMLKRTIRPAIGGKFFIAQVRSTGDMVRFNGKHKYDTIEDAIKGIMEEQK